MMDKRKLTKLIVQTVAAAFGLFGLAWIGMALSFAVTSIRDSDRFGLLFMTPMFIILGGIILAVAWQNLRRFGPKSIKNVTFLIVFSLYCELIGLVEPYLLELKMTSLEFAILLILLILSYSLYSVISRKLIQITQAENIQ